MVELADIVVLEATAERRGGSNPPLGTIKKGVYCLRVTDFEAISTNTGS